MSNFSYGSIEALDYDFTGVPSNSANGCCKGKGAIPEPTQAHLKAYAQALRNLYGLTEDDDPSNIAKAIKSEKSASAEERAERLLRLTADLCQGSPSAEELLELPPRIRNAFMKWVYQELSDPEVSSAGTRR